MKEFDLKKALNGAPICTLNGNPARILCQDFKGRNPEFPILVGITDDGGVERARSYNHNGIPAKNDKGMTLYMASIKHEGWVNIYSEKGEIFTSKSVFQRKEEANNEWLTTWTPMYDPADSRNDHQILKHLATVKIEWEE